MKKYQHFDWWFLTVQMVPTLKLAQDDCQEDELTTSNSAKKLKGKRLADFETSPSECWFFDQEPIRHKSASQEHSGMYTALKLAPPHGPQFQLKLYAMKKYSCHCRRCGHDFSQNVQKGVDNGIATKILSLAYENVCDRFILFAGDGDFYDSLNLIKNVLRKDLWVIGYRDTVSADLQQLATHVIWLNDLWPCVHMPAPQGQLGNGPSSAPAPASAPAQAPAHPSAAAAALVPAPALAPVLAFSKRPLLLPSLDEEDDNSLAQSATNSRRVRLERQVNIQNDGEQGTNNNNNRSRPKKGNNSRRFRDRDRERKSGGNDRERNGRRNRSRSRSRSRSPARENLGDIPSHEADQPPLFFVDTGRGQGDRNGVVQRTEPSVSASAAATASSIELPKKTRKPPPETGRRPKRKRQDPSPPPRPSDLMFELSDMSSEEDEQHPVIHTQASLFSKPHASSFMQSGNHDIIDLASDSE